MNTREDKNTEIATLVKEIKDKKLLFDPNKPKVVINKNSEAIYFSRQAIPFVQGIEKEKWLESHKFWHHIGMYAYRKDILKNLCELKYSLLDQVEQLEQLRWIENGYKIKIAESQYESISIDTPEDLDKIIKKKQ